MYMYIYMYIYFSVYEYLGSVGYNCVFLIRIKSGQGHIHMKHTLCGLFLTMYMYSYVYIFTSYIYMYIYIYVCVCMNMYIYIHTHTCTYISKVYKLKKLIIKTSHKFDEIIKYLR
jgi:hypothetical protein